MFGLRVQFFWEPPAKELSAQLSYPSPIWQVWQLYGGWPFSLHTLLLGARPWGTGFTIISTTYISNNHKTSMIVQMHMQLFVMSQVKFRTAGCWNDCQTTLRRVPRGTQGKQQKHNQQSNKQTNQLYVVYIYIYIHIHIHIYIYIHKTH